MLFYLQSAAQSLGADTTMAVPNMLEILPKGINKWVGMEMLLEDLQIDKEFLMSCGDGSNDLQLIANSGIGVAMGNAVPAVNFLPVLPYSMQGQGIRLHLQWPNFTSHNQVALCHRSGKLHV